MEVIYRGYFIVGEVEAFELLKGLHVLDCRYKVALEVKLVELLEFLKSFDVSNFIIA